MRAYRLIPGKGLDGLELVHLLSTHPTGWQVKVRTQAVSLTDARHFGKIVIRIG